MIDTATIDELTALHHDGRLSLARAVRLANEAKCPNDQARLLRIVGMCHLSRGRLRDARSAAAEARKLARTPIAQAEASEIRVAVAVDANNLDVARAVCSGLAAKFLWHPELEPRAIAHFRLGNMAAYEGSLDVAEGHWQAASESTQRPLYGVFCAQNLAKLELERGNLTQSWDLLDRTESITDRQRSFEQSIRALVLARKGQPRRAAECQRAALKFAHSRSVMDQTLLTVPLIEYLALAGLPAEAIELSRGLRTLIWQLEEQGEVPAALALVELARVTNTADILQASQRALISLRGLPSQQRDRSARRGRRKR